MICLEELSTSGSKTVFTQTSCYHFFHWACIYSYVEHCRREFEESRNECKSTISPAAEEEFFEVCICMHAYTHTCRCFSNDFFFGGVLGYLLVPELSEEFLQCVRIARNAERCTSQRDSVCWSVCPSCSGIVSR